MTLVEQREQLTDKMPSVEEYVERRIGSGATGVMFALNEYVDDIASSSAHSVEEVNRAENNILVVQMAC
jgi:hypothetical protein